MRDRVTGLFKSSSNHRWTRGVELCCSLITSSHGKMHEVPPTFPGSAFLRLRPKAPRGRIRRAPSECVCVTNRNVHRQEALQMVINTDKQPYASEAAPPLTKCGPSTQGARLPFYEPRNAWNTTGTVSSKRASAAVSCRPDASDRQTEYVGARRGMKASVFRTNSSHPSVTVIYGHVQLQIHHLK